MTCRLHIKICEARNVLKMDLGGRADPYVTLRLKSQDNKDIQKTSAIPNTLNPIWNQEFDIFVVDLNDVLLINMYDADIKYVDKMMNELQIPVNTWSIGGSLDRIELDIKLQKKNAGTLIFEVQSFPIEENENIENSESNEEETNSEIKGINNTIKLLTNSIKHVPFNNYDKDFTFIVNGQEFQTSRIISDLISPKISKIHLIDPTVSQFIITTKSEGNFQTILNLVSFELKEIDEKEIEFVFEIFDILEIENAEVKTNIELNIDNVIDFIQKHDLSSCFYSSFLSREIDYLSKHFYEIKENQIEKFFTFSIDTIEKVICNGNIKLESEDQLLKFINQLYCKNTEFYKLYEFVLFSNVEVETIDEFLSIFNYNDLTAGTWLSISKRLHNEIVKNNQKFNEDRYRKRFSFSSDNLNGVFNFLSKKSKIENEVKVTSSSLNSGDWQKLLKIDNVDNNYSTNNENNPWICFELKNHRICPSSYTIRSCNSYYGSHHPRSWLIEGSEDGKNWIIIDEQHDCSYLNMKNHIHTFSIKKNKKSQKEFKFIRIQHSGNCWDNSNNILNICSIEFYGDLI